MVEWKCGWNSSKFEPDLKVNALNFNGCFKFHCDNLGFEIPNGECNFGLTIREWGC